jgi:hypothetical protein
VFCTHFLNEQKISERLKEGLDLLLKIDKAIPATGRKGS